MVDLLKQETADIRVSSICELHLHEYPADLEIQHTLLLHTHTVPQSSVAHTRLIAQSINKDINAGSFVSELNMVYKSGGSSLDNF